MHNPRPTQTECLADGTMNAGLRLGWHCQAARLASGSCFPTAPTPPPNHLPPIPKPAPQFKPPPPPPPPPSPPQTPRERRRAASVPPPPLKKKKRPRHKDGFSISIFLKWSTLRQRPQILLRFHVLPQSLLDLPALLVDHAQH